jgi:hypothetical protein
MKSNVEAIAKANNNNWSFLPTALSGFIGICIGMIIGNSLGLI